MVFSKYIVTGAALVTKGQKTCWRSGNSAVAAIGLHGIQVRGDGFVPAPAPDVNMGGHVNVMSNPRLQRAQAVGRAIRRSGCGEASTAWM